MACQRVIDRITFDGALAVMVITNGSSATWPTVTQFTSESNVTQFNVTQLKMRAAGRNDDYLHRLLQLF